MLLRPTSPKQITPNSSHRLTSVGPIPITGMWLFTFFYCLLSCLLNYDEKLLMNTAMCARFVLIFELSLTLVLRSCFNFLGKTHLHCSLCTLGSVPMASGDTFGINQIWYV